MKKIIKTMYMILNTIWIMIINFFESFCYTILSLIFIFLLKKIYFNYIKNRIKINNNIFIENCKLDGSANDRYPHYEIQLENFNEYGLEISIVTKNKIDDVSWDKRKTILVSKINIPISDYFKIIYQLMTFQFCYYINKLNYSNSNHRFNISNKLKFLIKRDFNNILNEIYNG